VSATTAPAHHPPRSSGSEEFSQKVTKKTKRCIQSFTSRASRASTPSVQLGSDRPREVRDLFPGDYGDRAFFPWGVAAVEQGEINGVVARKGQPWVEAPEPIGGQGAAGFYSDGKQFPRLLGHDIHFQSGIIAPKKQVALFSPVEPAFEQFHDGPVLEERAPERVGRQLLRRLDPEQTDRHSDVPEVNLWSFYEALAEVSVMRRKPEGDIRSFQNG